jgi:2-dehydro-3-deoxyphosphogluconate aldolase/(4S)-4-hydroxy-2-oxoglutarate aldolase
VSKDEVRSRIQQTGLIAAVRVHTPEDALFAAEVIAEGGIPVVEITLTVPQACTVISRLAKERPGILVGAGGVTDGALAQQCFDAGAQFLTSDGLHPEVIHFAVKHDVVVFPGALTPTEVITAWDAGSDFVKVVPCVQIGGEAYIASLHNMFPHIPLVAAGGVSQQNAYNFIMAGALALGIGRELIPPKAIRVREADRIRELARRFLASVKAGREAHTHA